MKKLNLALIFFAVTLTSYGQTDPKDTEVWSPVPPVVTPGKGTSAPSDAIVLFDGKDLSQWTDLNGGAPKWMVKDGMFTVVKKTGNMMTKKSFGDIQLHLEWKAPNPAVGKDQDRGNSGVFLQRLYEVQVLDCYGNTTYSNGQTGSIYKQAIPLVNACRKPGEWQTYDIIFTAPKFKDDKTLDKPARITVIHNGVLIQNNFELKGATAFIGQPSYTAHGKAPIELQDHDHPVSYRNIWVREL